MILKGKAYKFGDSISTDLITPGRYFHLRSNLPELAKHILEDADPDFSRKVKPGDFIVAGRNFGLGSSREHAAIVIKMRGIAAVLASSFARIFYRNAINQGLPVIICDTSRIETGDELEVDIAQGKITNLSKNIMIKTSPLPKAMLNILQDGGLIEHLRKHGDFSLG